MSLGFCNPLHGGVVNGPINWKLPHTNRSQKLLIYMILDDIILVLLLKQIYLLSYFIISIYTCFKNKIKLCIFENVLNITSKQTPFICHYLFLLGSNLVCVVICPRHFEVWSWEERYQASL